MRGLSKTFLCNSIFPDCLIATYKCRWKDNQEIFNAKVAIIKRNVDHERLIKLSEELNELNVFLLVFEEDKDKTDYPDFTILEEIYE